MNVGAIGGSGIMSPSQIARASGSSIGAPAISTPKISASAAVKTPTVASIGKSTRGAKVDFGA